jgi:hypothetical protein
VQTLTELGRVRLSKFFFMRDFLFSDIAAIHGKVEKRPRRISVRWVLLGLRTALSTRR